ncbi:VCBS repeat protein [Pelagimonas varians]|uniref:FG-GAP repeat protein n=1 Tax=Pelagimonas varians TaxID=696760 RepID=A0A238L1R6_9RHOB|nr:FG-GAP-like repeat-containing protein [Pelagimonas varians]PYG26813.1 VCBS repeat protein [Pelagimonas varians]SMX48810.1 FG-GAP repeat protein [Pelagimonas varians]
MLPTFNQIFPVLGYIAIKEPTSPTSVSSPYIVHNSTGSSLSHINVGYGGSPAFADIDGDGDLDLVMGSADGTILSWRNDNGIYNSTGVSNPFAGIDVGTNSKPVFADIDGDGDLDLVVGDQTGALATWRNDGNGGYLRTYADPTPHVDTSLDLSDPFGLADEIQRIQDELAELTNPFSEIDVGYASRPQFMDIDGDGDLDLVVAASAGSVNSPTFWVENTQGAFPPYDVNTPQIYATRNVTVEENQVNARTETIFADAIVLDVEGNFTTGGLVVSGLLVEDRVSVLEIGGITVSGSRIKFNGVEIGTFTGGNGTDLQVTFGSYASTAAVQATARALGYSNSSDTPTLSRDFTVRVTEKTQLHATTTVTLDITPQNDSPQFANAPTSITVEENAANAAPVALAADILVTDAEGNISDGTLTVSGLLSEDRVSLRDAGGITVVDNTVLYNGVNIGRASGGVGADFSVTFNGSATSAALQATTPALGYGNVSDSRPPCAI